MEPIVYNLQSSIPRGFKLLQRLKCRQLKEALMTKKLEFPYSDEIKIKIDDFTLNSFLKAWDQLEEMLKIGSEGQYVEIEFEPNDPKFLIARDLKRFRGMQK